MTSPGIPQPRPGVMEAPLYVGGQHHVDVSEHIPIRTGFDGLLGHRRGQIETIDSTVAKMFQLDPEQISARLLLLGPGIVKDL